MAPLQEMANEEEAPGDYLASGRFLAQPPPGEDVVIAGLAGIFPDSEHVYHFRDNLYNKVDMVSCDKRRWAPTHPEIPQRTGKLFDIDRFDAGFFGLHYRQAHAMDPTIRLFLERAIEAVIDAGYHPDELQGSNTGVFVGACFSESEKTWFFDSLQTQNFAVSGTERSMVANRVSYYLQLKGPSFVTDTACSSSMYALEQAYKAIRNGVCEQAIVGGTNVCLHPYVSLQFARLGVLSSDGKCKVFSNDGDGYARSEAIGCIFLQKSRQARRIYAQVVHAKTNCDGYKEQGITYPSGEAQKRLLQEFYAECDIDPTALSFLEAHGTGTVVGDPEELVAIDEVFCKNRNTPLLVGSVKSNIGHSEPSSGLCCVTKAVIGFENGLIPPNLHFSKPREGVEALEKGRLRVVTEKMPFEDDRGLIAINSFGFGGGNAHVLLHWNQKVKHNRGIPRDEIPRLICVSGRIEEGVHCVFDDVTSRPLDAEHVRLIHQVYDKNIKGHNYRGYAIVSKHKEMKRSSRVSLDINRPLYLFFSDFNNNWSRMVQQLTIIPQIAATVNRINEILTGKNWNLSEKIQSKKRSKLDDVIGSMILQLAIADLIKDLEIQPRGWFGTGFGEIISAYFDTTITLEEAVLTTYAIASDKNPKLLVEKIIGTGRNHSGRWLSCHKKPIIPDYFLQHLESNDLTLIGKSLKAGGVVLEVGSRALKPLKKTVHQLTFSTTEDDSLLVLLDLLGRLYEFGNNFRLDRLYPPVEYPVSRGTGMLSPLIKWDHRNSWFVTFYEQKAIMKSGERICTLSLKDDEWLFVNGHVIDGRNLFPATAYLYMAWEALAKVTGIMTSDMQVVFENCKFLRATNVPKDSKFELTVMVQRGSGNFEVIESGTAIVVGRVSMFKKDAQEQIRLPFPLGLSADKALPLKDRDIYKELRLRGYNYKGGFRNLIECDNSATKGLIKWDGNWMTFMDGMLQMKILQIDTRFLYVPTGIKRLTIDAKAHLAHVQACGDNPQLPIHIYKDSDIIKCGGIEIRGLNASSISRRKPRGEPVLEKYEFVPNEAALDTSSSVRVIVQLVLENLPGYKVKAVELIDEATVETLEPLAPLIHQVLGDLPLIQPTISILTKKELEFSGITVEDKKLVAESDCAMVVASNLLQRAMILNQAFGAIKDNGFVISREPLDFEPKPSSLTGIDVITVHTTDLEKLYLIRKNVELKPVTVIDISNTSEDFPWLGDLQKAVKNAANVIVLAQNQALSGILGLVNCIRREPGCLHVKAVFTMGDAPEFDPNIPLYAEQLKKNLAINVFKNEKWGTYRHLLLEQNEEVEREHCFANALTRGDFSTIKWLQGPLSTNAHIAPEKELVHVYFCALNFRDIMTASGRISADVITRDRTQQEFIHGFEFSGRTKSGERVMGIVSGALSTLLPADRYLLWPVPEFWSLEEAATVPVVYSTILFAFFVQCSIRKGQSILIHAGSGGVGQASINLALHYGLTVFTTVGTQEKREFLKKQFPKLTDRQIGNSRDTSFEEMINKETNGRGVDYVLNSLAEEKLQASVRCLARGGNFLEIGKFDLASNNALRINLLEKDATFHGIMVDAVFALDPTAKVTIRRLMTEGILKGAIRPLIRTIFKHHEIEQAFRYMAAGKHIGKVLIEIRQEEVAKNAIPTAKLYKGLPRYACDPEMVQIIIGGLGGFGLELADWLILRGARKLILTTRRGVTTGYQSFRLRTWYSYGTQIEISQADVTTRSGCHQLITEAEKLGKVEALFNLAVVLKDALFENQTVDNFLQSLQPKAFATAFLDEVTRKRCGDLRDFVIFSSVSCGRGNAGQTNYGMANSIMERICEKRRQDGFPALAIEWGAVGDVGLVAEMQEEHTEIEIGGTLQQRIHNCLQVLDTFLIQKNAIVSSMVVAEKRGGAGGADNIVDAVANILGLNDLKTVSLHATLAELGMDSMTAVEIKQTLEREYEVFLTPQDIRSMTFARLIEIQEERATEDEDAKRDRPLGGFEMIVRLMNDEDTSRIPYMQLKTKIDAKAAAPRLLFFPGIEGVAKVLEPLAANLNVHVDCLQFPYEMAQDTIPEMAQALLPTVESLLSKTQRFCIVAYSFGAIVAMEVVSLLEANGYSGTLISLDGAPDMLGSLLKNSLNLNTEALFQTGFLCQLMSLHMPLDTILKNRDRLLMSKSFEERLNISEEIVPKDTPYSTKYLRSFSTALYKRLKALGHYEPQYAPIQAKVLLCKPHNISITGVADDYKLSELCADTVEVRVFKGNHVTLLDNLEMAGAIDEAAGVAPTLNKTAVIMEDGAGRDLLPEAETKRI